MRAARSRGSEDEGHQDDPASSGSIHCSFILGSIGMRGVAAICPTKTASIEKNSMKAVDLLDMNQGS